MKTFTEIFISIAVLSPPMSTVNHQQRCNNTISGLIKFSMRATMMNKIEEQTWNNMHNGAGRIITDTYIISAHDQPPIIEIKIIVSTLSLFFFHFKIRVHHDSRQLQDSQIKCVTRTILDILSEWAKPRLKNCTHNNPWQNNFSLWPPSHFGPLLSQMFSLQKPEGTFKWGAKNKTLFSPGRILTENVSSEQWKRCHQNLSYAMPLSGCQWVVQRPKMQFKIRATIKIY